jgi:transposase
MESKLTLLSQIFQLIPEPILAPILDKYEVKSNAQRYGYRTQLLCLLLCHLGQADSLRDVVHALTTMRDDLPILKASHVPSKSAFSYMNRVRPWQFFQDLYLALYKHFYGNTSLDSLAAPIYALDSTTISLCLKTYNWAHFRSTKGGIKLHTLLDLKSCLPAFVHITKANRHDATQMNQFVLPEGSWVIMDRGYVDYARLSVLHDRKVNFVVRSKENLRLETLVTHKTNVATPEVLYDKEVKPIRTASESQYGHKLRLVGVMDPQTGRKIELLTNNTEVQAAQLGQLYRARWQVENFFKHLKQHLVVKSFIGSNDNAVMSQIWTGLISILLTKYVQKKAKDQRAFSNTINHIRIHLMTKQSLYECLKWPFGKKKKKIKRIKNNQYIQQKIPGT